MHTHTRTEQHFGFIEKRQYRAYNGAYVIIIITIIFCLIYASKQWRCLILLPSIFPTTITLWGELVWERMTGPMSPSQLSWIKVSTCLHLPKPMYLFRGVCGRWSQEIAYVVHPYIHFPPIYNLAGKNVYNPQNFQSWVLQVFSSEAGQCLQSLQHDISSGKWLVPETCMCLNLYEPGIISWSFKCSFLFPTCVS